MPMRYTIIMLAAAALDRGGNNESAASLLSWLGCKTWAKR